MSHLSNVPDDQQGFFKPGVQPTGQNQQPHGPFPQDKHSVGTKASPADYVPEFNLETHPPGTAPASSSYQPNPIDHPGEQALNPNVQRSHGKESVRTTAEQTLTGATSKDVHQRAGHPGSGQSSAELHHDGQHSNKNPGRGIEGAMKGVHDDFTTRTEQNLTKKPTVAGGSHAAGSLP
ncbi:hypothetical protein BDW62DRAFT_117306 [Aspergillus aurantiobrunneus]